MLECILRTWIHVGFLLELDPSLARYGGRIVKVEGDDILVEFANAEVLCAGSEFGYGAARSSLASRSVVSFSARMRSSALSFRFAWMRRGRAELTPFVAATENRT